MEGDIQKSDHTLPGCGKEKNSDFTLKNSRSYKHKGAEEICGPWLSASGLAGVFVTLSSDWFVRSISFP